MLSSLRMAADRIAELEKENEQLKDLARFLAENWVEVDKFVYSNCPVYNMDKYPVIQGTRNQLDLSKIGSQEYKTENIRKAVDLLLEQ